MKRIKSVIALLIVLVLAFSLCACHQKGEVALTSGDYEITSAMYSYYLVMADSQAKEVINNDTEKYDTSAEGFDYLKQTIDGKKYADYVKELAINNCLKAVAYQKLCDEKEIELDTDAVANIDYTVSYYWNNYGYSSIMPENGVGYETYAAVTKNDYLGDAYFKALYGKDGEKAIEDSALQSAMDENYVAAYVLHKDYSSDENAKPEDIVAEMEKYKKRLTDGESFEKVYKEFNGIKDEEKTEETESEEPAPKDEYISVLGSEETNNAFAKFADVKSMAVDEMKIISDTDNKVVYLVIKKDINSDSYYKETYLADNLLYLVKGDEFEEYIEGYIKELDYSVSNFAINQFKVKNISYGY